MTNKRIDIMRIAAITSCIDGINTDRINHYRQLLRVGKEIEPIQVYGMNTQGFYVLKDGHHRTLAHAIENCSEILAEIDPITQNLSWRWPCIAPIIHTIDLIKMLQPMWVVNKNYQI